MEVSEIVERMVVPIEKELFSGEQVVEMPVAKKISRDASKVVSPVIEKQRTEHR